MHEAPGSQNPLACPHKGPKELAGMTLWGTLENSADIIASAFTFEVFFQATVIQVSRIMIKSLVPMVCEDLL